MKNLYILTPAVTRHDCHNNGIIPSVKFLSDSNLFENVIWFVNVDNPKSSRFEFEDRKITVDNFKKSNIGSATLDIHLPDHPCFYEAFSLLLNKMKVHIDINNIKQDEFCFLWLEDDWVLSKHDKLVRDLKYFISNDKIKFYTLYKNKINMGGNPQFIKGELYEKYFRNLNLSIENKRDPEIIFRNEIFKDNIFNNVVFETLGIEQNIINSTTLTFKDKLNIANNIASSQNDTFIIHNGMYGYTIEDIGDEWKALRGFMKWSMKQKEHGINPDENYTYN